MRPAALVVLALGSWGVCAATLPSGTNITAPVTTPELPEGPVPAESKDVLGEEGTEKEDDDDDAFVYQWRRKNRD
ncbi:hypothetical protein F4780DRAFT_784777 [Xylariomycetidae sp. FL0641]|nr:hypothetical protein F4780DRAFT_784777 [Xylariomycetidae sp. FL0641]